MSVALDPGLAGPDGILVSISRNERLARALVMGVPAFLRRARALEASLEALHATIAAERERRLERLRARPRDPRALEVEWTAYLDSIPLDEIRRAQASYNRYYSIERELALPDAPPVPFREVPLLDHAALKRRYGELAWILRVP